MIAIGKSNKKNKVFGPNASKVSNRVIRRDHISIDSKTDEKHSWKYMYSLPPVGKISLEDFECSTVDRLKLLRLIDNWKTRGRKGKDLFELIREESNKLFGTEPLETCERDWISHHTLRLAFSKNTTLQSWFKSQEVTLYEARLYFATDAILRQIVSNNELDVEIVPLDEVKLLAEQGLRSMYQLNYFDEKTGTAPSFNPELVQVYKVPFTTVNKLVQSRRVLLERGRAYVFSVNLLEYITQFFRSKLSESMAYIYRVWPHLEEKESDRLLPFLTTVANKGIEPVQNMYKSMSTHGRQITPDMIDDLAQQSFPLCMRDLHKNLRREHKLKHQGRMQYGLFLKGIGLTLDQSLQFWQSEFTKVMTENEFNKNYAYNIRHSYGKEGKQTNYSPYGCMKIIKGLNKPGDGEHHGCPFRNFSEQNLRNEMRNVSDQQSVDEIVNLVKGSHYQVACRRYFEATHPDINNFSELAKNDDGAPFPHPNVYFMQSRRLLEAHDKLKGKEPTAPATVTTTATTNK